MTRECPACIKTRDRIAAAISILTDALTDAADGSIKESTAKAAGDTPRVEIVREPSTNEGTFGVLMIDGKQFCHTCELPWRDNVRNVSCIPTGTYQCEMINRESNGQPAYWIKDVQGRSGIVIHSGNTIADTNGCPLLGMKRGKLDGKEAVLSSRNAIAAFHAEMDGKPFELVVRYA